MKKYYVQVILNRFSGYLVTTLIMFAATTAAKVPIANNDHELGLTVDCRSNASTNLLGARCDKMRITRGFVYTEPKHGGHKTYPANQNMPCLFRRCLPGMVASSAPFPRFYRALDPSPSSSALAVSQSKFAMLVYYFGNEEVVILVTSSGSLEIGHHGQTLESRIVQVHLLQQYLRGY